MQAHQPIERGKPRAITRARSPGQNAKMQFVRVQLRPGPILRAPASRQGGKPLDPSILRKAQDGAWRIARGASG